MDEARRVDFGENNPFARFRGLAKALTKENWSHT